MVKTLDEGIGISSQGVGQHLRPIDSTPHGWCDLSARCASMTSTHTRVAPTPTRHGVTMILVPHATLESP